MNVTPLASTAFRSNGDYQTWIEREEPVTWARETRSEGRSEPGGPLISVVLPCRDPSPTHITALLDSMAAQTYGHWQLCVADASPGPEVSRLLRAKAQADGRISYSGLPAGAGAAGMMNHAIDMAQGEWLGLIGQHDTLSPHALAEVVGALDRQTPPPDVLYSDEDAISADGTRRLLPFFKPDWSPELSFNADYASRLVVLRKALVDAVGGVRPQFEGALDYDLLLRVTERTDRIAHLPFVLYHRRLGGGSVDGVDPATEAARRRAASAAVERRGVLADIVETPDEPGGLRLRYRLPPNAPKVSVIIPFRDRVVLLKRCLGSILSKTTYENVEIILVSNNSTEAQTEEFLENLRDERCRLYRWDHPFNYAAINNFASRHARGDYLILLNNDTEVLTPTWIEELVGVASQPGIGAVGALLLYPNMKVQHAGVVVGMAGMAGHPFRHRRPTDLTAFGRPDWPRNYLAVTGACLAVRSATFAEVGGLDERFVVAGNDVAFCIRLHEAGYRNVLWPFARLLHHESATVGGYDTGIRSDFDRCLEDYGLYLGGNDPFFNVNLDRNDEQIGFAFRRGGIGHAVRRGVKRQELRARRVHRAYSNQGLLGVARKIWRRATWAR